MMLFVFLACLNQKSDSERDVMIDTATEFEPSWEPSSEPSSEEDSGSEDTAEPDPEPEVVLLNEGDWNLGSPTLISDACGVAEFQDVSGFVPSSVGVTDSQPESFVMLPDGLNCERNATELRCDTFYFDEETSAVGLAATLAIKNEITGEIESASEMSLDFDVTIQSCDGPGCWFIEAALSFPCLLQQRSQASHQ